MSVNKFICIGNVGKDPEIRALDSGVKVANFSLGLTERGYTKQDGTKIEGKTEWVNIVAWRGLAEIVEKYANKGSKLYVEGKLRTRSYDDQNGVKRYITEVFADNIELLSPKSDSGQGGSVNSAPAQSSAPQAAGVPPIGDGDLPF